MKALPSADSAHSLPVTRPALASDTAIIRPADLLIAILALARPAATPVSFVSPAATSHALPPLVRSGIFLI